MGVAAVLWSWGLLPGSEAPSPGPSRPRDTQEEAAPGGSSAFPQGQQPTVALGGKADVVSDGGSDLVQLIT